MASQRPRALAEVLAHRGHSVTVLTMATPPEATAPYPPGVEVIETVPYDDKVFAPVTEIPLHRRLLAALSVLSSTPEVIVLKSAGLAKLFGLKPEESKQRLDELNARRYRTASGTKSISEAYRWYRQSAPIAKAALKGREPYDVVFATYSTHGSVWLGRFLHSKGFARKLIVDLRDLMNQPGSLLPLRLFRGLQERQALDCADAVTVVSKGLRTNLMETPSARKHKQKVSVLYNGFLPRSTDPSTEAAPSKGPLKIAYTGSLYQGRRDASALFQVLENLKSSRPLSDVEVHYAGPSGNLLQEMAEAHGVGSVVVDHGVVSREDALRLQKGADVLLALSWNEPGSEGIVSGKFPEYLGANKPIVSIVMGSLPRAELTTLVEDMNVGVTLEESTQDKDIPKLTQYLQDAVDAKSAGEPVPHSPNAPEVEKFNYENLATQLEDIIEGLASETTNAKPSLLKRVLKS